MDLPLYFPDIGTYWSKLSEITVKCFKIFVKGKILLVNPEIPLLECFPISKRIRNKQDILRQRLKDPVRGYLSYHLNTLLDWTISFRIFTLRFDFDICSHHKFSCGEMVTTIGSHGLNCSKSPRKKVLFRLFNQTGLCCYHLVFKAMS